MVIRSEAEDNLQPSERSETTNESEKKPRKVSAQQL